MRALISLALIACVAGCASQAELIAQKQREVDRMIQLYGPACEKLGYQANSDPWRDCILRLSTKDSLDRYNYPTTINCFGSFGFSQCTTF
jgi:hypothetical protein